MPTYRLSKDAKQDLKEVTRYTLNKWGEDALKKYIGGLTKTFEAIGAGDVHMREFFKSIPRTARDQISLPLRVLFRRRLGQGRHYRRDS